MKEIRYIPYGYTIEDGKLVVEKLEAGVIQYIFDAYIKGMSLKEVADELTDKKVTYTEKTSKWDKARVARILDNARYTGSEEYGKIIDEEIYEKASSIKASRQRNKMVKENEAIELLRGRMYCAQCGFPMLRRIDTRRKIKESWTCQNPECGIRVRISDSALTDKITHILNRIIQNADLMLPSEKGKKGDSAEVKRLQDEIDAELEKEKPDEEFITSKIIAIASQMYCEAESHNMVAGQIAKQKVLMMHPLMSFDSMCFSDLIDNVYLDTNGKISLITKTETTVNEGDVSNE